MSDAITVKVLGLEQINRALDELPRRIANKVLRKGVYSGAALLRGAIKREAPVRSESRLHKMSSGEFRGPGFLRKNIRMKFRSKVSGPGEKHYIVGPLGQAFYGRFVEAGHKSGKRGGGKMVPAHPFMIPTFNTMTSQITEKMKDGLTKGIIKEGMDMGFTMKE
jgi:HK97 gp10 family phage protein